MAAVGSFRLGGCAAPWGSHLGDAALGQHEKKVVDQRAGKAGVQRGHDRALHEVQLLHPGGARDRHDERSAAQPDRVGALGNLGPDGVLPNPPDGGRTGCSEGPVEARRHDGIDGGGLGALPPHAGVLSVRAAMAKALRSTEFFS